MKRILIVVDMQNDFITGALGTKKAQAILPKVRKKIREFPGEVLFTRDTHEENYLSTTEGKKLPVPHCIRGTSGWELEPSIQALCKTEPVDKPTFGSLELGERLNRENQREPIGEIQLIGLCTDICVISNALLLKAALPEAEITVDSSCCAGVSPQSHETALRAMAGCQIQIL